ncbi:MAG: hypothetical protein K5769_02230 [Pseudobutyrivibrio sp.]|nr:hypothetical protein [Pseudobutyrivibrio sp.]
MAIGEIIACTSAEDLFRKAEDLQERGIQTVFVARNTLKIVQINEK